jgi:polyhydroxybutyrate depolymerase
MKGSVLMGRKFVQKLSVSLIVVTALSFCVSACASSKEPLRERIRGRIREKIQDRFGAKKEVPNPQDTSGVLMFQKRERTFLLHLPREYQPSKAVPLVIAFHGGGGNAENMAQMSGMSQKANAEGFIVVYPNGTGKLKDRFLTWNTWNCCGYSVESQVDDVGFIRALIQQLKSTYAIDSNRIYATGISNGGMMAYRVAVELSDQIAAIAPVSGALNVDNPSPSTPVSVIIFHGTGDQSLLYEGGQPKKLYDKRPRVDKSVPSAVNFWVNFDGCAPTPKRNESGNIVIDAYSGGKNGTEVVLYTIKNGTHSWPGGQKGRFSGDGPTKEISATDIMWKFFARHPKLSEAI